MAEFSAADLAVEDQYKLMSGAIIPRPIALTVTKGPNGPNDKLDPCCDNWTIILLRSAR